MNTEITDTRNENGWLCFDAQCGLCALLAHRFGPLLRRHRFALVPLQTPWVRDCLLNAGEALLSEMRLIAPHGRVHGGADALLEIARRIWWAKPLYWLSRVPLVKPALRSGYRWVARNRACLGGSCASMRPKPRPATGALGSIAAFLPTLLALTLGRGLPAWVWMWTIALALFLGSKWITILQLVRTGHRPGLRLLAYSFLWPGMDANAFCGNKLTTPPHAREWTLAATKTLLGAAVLWLGAPLTPAPHPLITGWVGMIGIVLLLHFGLFHLLSVLWRSLGINAQPIMQGPVMAASLSGFWGGRWNAAFSNLMHKTLFTPLSRSLGPRGALLLVFLVSGALHELVISVPARGGYGLPSAYFLLQGLGLLFEHSRPARKLGLGSGFRGWCFVALIAGLPAFWLLHPIFIHRVILPMLHAIGAT